VSDRTTTTVRVDPQTLSNRLDEVDRHGVRWDLERQVRFAADGLVLLSRLPYNRPRSV